ncbi:uncharacterized protein B0P05DRAFT_504740 [Gilbertella persicaria]|uniref:uncharacterized protein n=1 Tax=Gilbertella persicaria TaxID=101096 RepID=UPI0022201232|nr:uncharacterized protein B0P05DRAFT_504740 [Gilbertella persicaria]KAI8091120.1 hypothetical protein B0P05DRAFT_504740 [Gilbertella persicaria]
MTVIFIVLSLTIVSTVYAIIPTARYNGGCAAVQKQLHCYGGTSNRKPSTDHYALDLSNDFDLENSINAWNMVDPGNFELEPNSLFSIVPINDSFLIHGGLGYGSFTQFIKNTTTLYNITSHSWHTVVANNQSFMMPSREETSTLDPFNRIWTWGGISDNSSSPNITDTTYHKDLQVLDFNTLSWSFPDKNTKTSSNPTFLLPRLAHSATLARSGDSIYYIGGLQLNQDNVLNYAPMNEILQYNITNHTWTLHTSPPNTTIPSPRRLHSATMIPYTDLILIYGGSVTDGASTVADYIYFLNTTSFIYTPVHIVNTKDGAGPRFGHSAVLYDEKSLFIIFGADELGSLRNDFLVLDIVNWQWISSFKANGVYPVPSTTGTTGTASNPIALPTPSNPTSGSLSLVFNQSVIAFSYLKTVYLVIGIALFYLK